MKTIDQIYLERLSKSLQSLLKRLKKGKRGSAFTKTEIRALTDFSIGAKEGLSGFVRSLRTQTKIIPMIQEAKRDSGIFYIQMILSMTLRLSFLLKKVDIKKLKAVQRELQSNNVMQMERKTLNLWKDEIFEGMIIKFLKIGGKFNDHIYKNTVMLPEMYLDLLDYYLSNKKDISGTKQWYDFLAISQYMLYGTKLEILELQNLKKR